MTELQQAILDILRVSGRPERVKDIKSLLRDKVPHLCNDSVFPCPYCGERHTKWYHQVTWAIQYLKIKSLIQSPKRGLWKAV